MSVDSIIESLVSRQLKTKIKIAPPPQLRGTVVTVARSCGSGGEDVARLLAERLGLRCYDAELVVAIAEDARTDRRIMAQLDEHSQHLMDGWLRAIITGKGAFAPDYRRALVDVVLGISHSGGVIVGRGANFILSGKNVFRVRIVCPFESCVARIAEQENIDTHKAEKHVLKVDKHRDKFIKQVFPSNVHASASYDVTLNTDAFSFDQAVEVILFAMEQRGYEVPKPRVVAA